MELSQDIGHRPIVFIRFNPDEYVTKDNKVTSCWANNKLGICTVKKTKEKEWTQRLEALKDQVENWLENKTEKTIEIVQLFYDIK
jgi:Holliday junction resolvasome RuvABC endonuclease subunit